MHHFAIRIAASGLRMSSKFIAVIWHFMVHIPFIFKSPGVEKKNLLVNKTQSIRILYNRNAEKRWKGGGRKKKSEYSNIAKI
jgi:hypothetical protein